MSVGLVDFLQDSDSVADAFNTHHYSASAAAATGAALSRGGCDIDSGDTYFQNIGEALENGEGIFRRDEQTAAVPQRG